MVRWMPPHEPRVCWLCTCMKAAGPLHTHAYCTATLPCVHTKLQYAAQHVFKELASHCPPCLPLAPLTWRGALPRCLGCSHPPLQLPLGLEQGVQVLVLHGEEANDVCPTRWGRT